MVTSSTAPSPSLKNVLAFARLVVSHPYGTGSPIERTLAEYLVSTLGDGDPGLPDPEVYTGAVIVTREMVGEWKPEQITAMARSMLLAAEKAQEQPS